MNWWEKGKKRQEERRCSLTFPLNRREAVESLEEDPEFRESLEGESVTGELGTDDISSMHKRERKEKKKMRLFSPLLN